VVDTGTLDVDESVAAVIAWLVERGVIPA